MTKILILLKKDIATQKDPAYAKNLQRFFKTGKGEYGEGDVFLGLRVPQCRAIATAYADDISLKDLTTLISSPFHEERLVALLILVEQFKNANTRKQKNIYNYYLSHTQYINNWDLVDLSAHHIVGAHLFTMSHATLFALAKSDNLWERRIAVVATFYFIKEHAYDSSLAIAELLLKDPHDLIHKAVGWMLREVGKNNIAIEKKFLDTHVKQMPRTMLRYAIERFPEKERQRYLKIR
jgi:3-methyladenine DNA glycosylase AlkD